MTSRFAQHHCSHKQVDQPTVDTLSMWTYAAHQSMCRCRRLLAPSRSDGSWGMSSTCSPDFADHPCHSGSRQNNQNRIGLNFVPESAARLTEPGFITPALIGILDLVDETITHPTELSDAGVCGLPQPLGLNRRLAEEEKYLVIIRVLTFWYPKGTNKLWFW